MGVCRVRPSDTRRVLGGWPGSTLGVQEGHCGAFTLGPTSDRSIYHRTNTPRGASIKHEVGHGA